MALWGDGGWKQLGDDDVCDTRVDAEEVFKSSGSGTQNQNHLSQENDCFMAFPEATQKIYKM